MQESQVNKESSQVKDIGKLVLNFVDQHLKLQSQIDSFFLDKEKLGIIEQRLREGRITLEIHAQRQTGLENEKIKSPSVLVQKLIKRVPRTLKLEINTAPVVIFFRINLAQVFLQTSLKTAPTAQEEKQTMKAKILLEIQGTKQSVDAQNQITKTKLTMLEIETQAAPGCLAMKIKNAPMLFELGISLTQSNKQQWKQTVSSKLSPSKKKA